MSRNAATTRKRNRYLQNADVADAVRVESSLIRYAEMIYGTLAEAKVVPPIRGRGRPPRRADPRAVWAALWKRDGLTNLEIGVIVEAWPKKFMAIDQSGDVVYTVDNRRITPYDATDISELEAGIRAAVEQAQTSSATSKWEWERRGRRYVKDGEAFLARVQSARRSRKPRFYPGDLRMHFATFIMEAVGDWLVEYQMYCHPQRPAYRRLLFWKELQSRAPRRRRDKGEWEAKGWWDEGGPVAVTIPRIAPLRRHDGMSYRMTFIALVLRRTEEVAGTFPRMHPVTLIRRKKQRD